MSESAIERVTLTSTNGARLAAVVHRPDGVRDLGGRPAVVLCHGMESTKEGTKHQALAQRFAAAGLVCLRFDFAYVGESSGRFLDLTISGEVADLAGVCTWLWTRGTTTVGLIGSSLGGTVAVLFAGGEPRVRALVTIAALARPLGILERLGPEAVREWRRAGFRQESSGPLGSAFLDDLARVDVLAAASRVRAATLVTHGDRDLVVPVEEAQALYAALPQPKALAIVHDCDHRYSAPAHLATLLDTAVDWTVRHLAGRAAGDVSPSGKRGAAGARAPSDSEPGAASPPAYSERRDAADRPPSDATPGGSPPR